MAVVSKTIDKVKAFEKEIGYLKTDKYKEYLKNIIPLIPEYFFIEGASSSGKYHPKFAQGEGGLLRHTKVAVRIGHELLINNSLNYKYNEEQRDMLLCALLLHDSLKYGVNKSSSTKFDHPILAGEFVRENKFNLTSEEVRTLSDLIKTHMGEWTKDYNGLEVLEKPKNSMQRFVHMCDYLASKKFLDVEFDENDIVY